MAQEFRLRVRRIPKAGNEISSRYTGDYTNAFYSINAIPSETVAWSHYAHYENCVVRLPRLAWNDGGWEEPGKNCPLTAP